MDEFKNTFQLANAYAILVGLSIVHCPIAQIRNLKLQSSANV